MMWWGSGNLDPSVFADPTRFDPMRASNRHLAFGIGGHACIGRQFSSVITEEGARAAAGRGASGVQSGTPDTYGQQVTGRVR
jgi:Cytochrome P450